MIDRDLFHVEVRLSGEQRLYRFRDMLGGEWGLSVVNDERLHCFAFAREIAVVRFEGDDASDFRLSYSTPLTTDVEVFDTDEEADEFVARARVYFLALSLEEVAALDARDDEDARQREASRRNLLRPHEEVDPCGGGEKVSDFN